MMVPTKRGKNFIIYQKKYKIYVSVCVLYGVAFEYIFGSSSLSRNFIRKYCFEKSVFYSSIGSKFARNRSIGLLN